MATPFSSNHNAGRNGNQAGPPGRWARLVFWARWLLDLLPLVFQNGCLVVIVLLLIVCVFHPPAIGLLILLIQAVADTAVAMNG